MTTVAKRLPLHEFHERSGGRFGAFGEWEVPLYFSSILDEHETVRNRAGLFDISHMGELSLGGKEAKRFLDFLLPRRMERLETGRALYAPMLNESGGIVDDLVVYQRSADDFLLIVNAGTTQKDEAWIRSHLAGGVSLENATEDKFLFALQGPRSLEVISSLFDCDFHSLRYYHFLTTTSKWGDLLISRTGYTGEDGFELLGEMDQAPGVWEALIKRGASWGVKPAGFGARDTLRLEAGMLLYGQDMDDSTSPLQAGLGWAVDLEKKEFMGRGPLVTEKEKGSGRRLIGFEMIGRGIPRHGYEIKKEGKVLGPVTSGGFAPTLKKNIGLGYIPATEVGVGNELEIIIREHPIKAKIVKTPFYKRNS